MNILSIIFGVIGAFFMFIGLLPLFGWVNWIMLPFAVSGILVGIFCKKKTGMTLSIFVATIGAIRLTLGGGVF